MKIKFSILFFLFCFVPLLQAQDDFVCKQLAKEKANIQSITYAVAQQDNGFVWIATEEGVVKYDSNITKAYTSYNGLPATISNLVSALFIDDSQTVWAGFENGLCSYNPEMDEFQLLPTKDDYAPKTIASITNDPQGNIWVAAYNGLWKYDPSTSYLKLVLPRYVVNAVAAFDEVIYLGTDKGMIKFLPDTETIETVVPLQENTGVITLKNIKGQLFAGTKTGNLFEIKKGDKKVIEVFNTKGFPIRDIEAAKDNSLYVATDGSGIYNINEEGEVNFQTTENIDEPNSLSSNGIYDIEVGLQDIVWIATYGGGINYLDYNTLSFQNIYHETKNNNSIITNFTRSIEKDKRGNIWFGTKKGLSIWDVKENRWTHIASLSNSSVTNPDIVLALQSDGDFMWAGTYNDGLYTIDITTLKAKKYTTKKPLVQKIYALHKDKEGGIWVGGLEGETGHILANDTLVTYKLGQIKAFENIAGNELLAVGRNGMYKINWELQKAVEYPALNPDTSELKYTNYNALKVFDEDHLVLATNGAGVLFFELATNNITTLTAETGLPSNTVQGIIVEDKNNIWASTTNGLAHIQLSKKDTLITVFDQRDGLASTEFNYGSYAKLGTKTYAFGGVDGVTLFNPNTVKDAEPIPQLHFQSFTLFDEQIEAGSELLTKDINFTDKIELDHEQNSIQFNFAAISYNPAVSVKYSWRLKGFEENWSTPTTTNKASYTNLSWGDYVFQVKAGDKYGNYGPIKEIEIIISPPWYATWWAYILYGLLVIGAIFGIIYITSVIFKKKNADEQIDFFNNITHEIKTPLAILISSLDQTTQTMDTGDDAKKRIKTTVKRINSLFEQMLNFHKSTAGSLAQDISEINTATLFEKVIDDFAPMTKERNIKIIFKNERLEASFYYDKEMIKKIIQNLVSNGIKYSNEGGIITITAHRGKADELNFSVKDEGIGIPKDQQKHILKKYYRARNVINSQRPGTGLGLMMIKNLIDKSGGKISFESEENVGTTFRVSLMSLQKKYKEKLREEHNKAQSLVNEISDQTTLTEYSDSKILIVEDNDELREMMINALGVYFQVYEAKNGKEGLELAGQIFPDIILTDLIMPEMDGQQLVKKLKDDINLNHIPVFMLTVLQNSNQKLESLELGITEYIEKPIDVKVLIAKIVNSLKWQKKLRKKYIQESDADTAEIFRNKKDSKFLKKLEKDVIKNIDDKSFSVHDLSANFGMSRTSLYMKLKNLVDLSPQDFIIHTKLKRAKKLLIKGDYSIKEVAYASGFSNPKYFSTSFKKFYGMTPSAFIESLQKKK